MMLSLTPLCPDEVTPTSELLICHDLILCSVCIDSNDRGGQVISIVTVFLSVEPLLLYIASVPPGATSYNLSDTWVIIAFADIKTEDLRRVLRFYPSVLHIKDSVQFSQHLLIYLVQKVRHLKHFLIEHNSIAPWYGDAKVFQQLDDLLV